MSGPFQATPTNFFSPRQISGCLLWLDANDPNGTGVVSTAGSVMTNWVDKSGSNNTVTANGSPVFSNYNSRNAVYINSNWFSRAGTYAIANTTIFFVFSMSTPVGDKSYFQMGANPNSSGGDTTTFFSDANVARPGGTAAGRIYFGSGGSTLLSTQFPTATAADAIPYCIQTARITSSPFVENFRNGALQNSRTGTVARVNHSGLIVGSSNGGWQWTGYMSEIIVYNSALSDTARQQVEGYLATKWNLQANLPGSNPYSSTPLYSSYPFPALISPSINTVTRIPYGTNAAAFLPPQISGCGLWLDGRDPNGNNRTPSVGTSIATWVDKSGLAANATSVGTQATFASGGGLLFATNGAYNTPYSASLTNESLFIVFRYTTPNSQKALVAQTGDGGRAITITAGATTAAFESSVYNVAFGAVSPSTTVPQNAIGIGELVTTNSNMAIWYNGTPFGTPTTVTITPGRTSVVGGAYNAGSPNTSQYFGGTLFEIIGYTAALTTAQRQQVEGYLAWKWNLVSSLPNGHPYKVPQIVPFPYQIRQGGQVIWSPLTITGCGLWLDAADRNTITFSGSNITSWRDKSATNTTAITSNGASANPILFQNSGVYINNNSSLFYDASTYSMMVVQSNIMISSDYTIAIVVNNPTNTTPALFSDQRAAGASETRSQLNHGFIFEVSTGGSGRTTSPNTAAGTGTRILIGTSVPAQSQFFNNGSLTGSNTTAITSYSTDAGGLPTLGGYRDTETARTDNSWFTGTMFEVIFYTSALTTSQRQQVEGYLAWKWRIQSSLPANHPYRNIPPI